ncbi:MAG: hypothetical protein ACJ77L_13345 [Solirubrobacteraceae bacterium]
MAPKAEVGYRRVLGAREPGQRGPPGRVDGDLPLQGPVFPAGDLLDRPQRPVERDRPRQQADDVRRPELRPDDPRRAVCGDADIQLGAGHSGRGEVGDTWERVSGRRQALGLEDAVLVPDRQRAVVLVDDELDLTVRGRERMHRPWRAVRRKLADLERGSETDLVDPRHRRGAGLVHDDRRAQRLVGRIGVPRPTKWP